MKAQLLVARNLRRLRVQREVSQEVLAVDAGIDRTYVSRLERSLENPSVAVLERLAKALDADIRDLFDPAGGGRGVIRPLPSGRRKKV
jgi:transcriptional regulator with XRE-family HTH domain